MDLAPVFAKKGIAFKPVAATKLHPESNTLDLADGTSITYDYLINATGPELAFDEIEGLGPEGNTQSVCHVSHAMKAHEAFEAFCKNPAPIIVGAVQGASCFGPAYEFLFILETELRRRKIRDRVPMTFVTAEPYIGHLGLDGVGDTKGLLESEMRSKHIKWVTSARVKKVDPGMMTVEEVGDDGAVKATKELPFGFSMMLPAFRGIPAMRGIEGLSNPRGFTLIDKFQRNPKYQNIFAVGVCVAIPPTGATPVACGVPKTGFMIESMVTATAHNIGKLLRGEEPRRAGDVECRLPRRLRRLRGGLRRPAADPAAQRQLVVVRQVGAWRQDRLREILPAQDQEGHQRNLLREAGPRCARHRQAQADGRGSIVRRSHAAATVRRVFRCGSCNCEASKTGPVGK